jgi:hypothetical protein
MVHFVGCWKLVAFMAVVWIPLPVVRSFLVQTAATRTLTTAATAAPLDRKICNYRSFRKVPLLHMVVTRPDEIPATNHASATTEPSDLSRYLTEFAGILAFSAASAWLLISWEDLTCSYVLPSRHRTSLSLYQPAQPWGASTVHGMGFGVTERQLIAQSGSDDPLANLLSYNEVMLHHRTETVPQWKQAPTSSNTQAAIHTVTSSLQKVWKLQAMANDYQWENVRTELHAPPLSDLPAAAAVLRHAAAELKQVVGFDWGSCAWRHCGAVADTQEALDELEQLLGVLEPYEAVFCLDIVERSLRDIIAVIPWQQASPQDVQFYADLPVYVSKISADAADDDEEATSRIDDAYLKALQELRID